MTRTLKYKTSAHFENFNCYSVFLIIHYLRLNGRGIESYYVRNEYVAAVRLNLTKDRSEYKAEDYHIVLNDRFRRGWLLLGRSD